jgi:OFA family oxalate/formate antiporter-like MFS transporter
MTQERSFCRVSLSFPSRSLRCRSLTDHVAHFYAVFFILGVVGNGTAYLGYSRAIASWFSKRRGMAFAVMLAGGGCVAMLLPPVHPSLDFQLRVAVAYFGVGCIAFAVGFPLTGLFVRERPAGESVGIESLLFRQSVRQALKSRIFWVLMVTVGLYSIGANGAIAHLAALLSWPFFAIGGAFGPIILGHVFDTLGSYRPLAI